MGDTFDVSHYLGVFIEEAKEHIESLEENLAKLEKNPTIRPYSGYFPLFPHY